MYLAQNEKVGHILNLCHSCVFSMTKLVLLTHFEITSLMVYSFNIDNKGQFVLFYTVGVYIRKTNMVS